MPFTVIEPTEFIEISYHADCMRKEEAKTAMRTATELVIYGYSGKEKCLVVTMYASGEVEVFSIHKIAFVE